MASAPRETAAERKERLLRHLWTLANAFLKEMPNPWEDAAELVDAVKLKVGLVLPGHTLEGQFYPRLISSRHMTLAQVEHLHDQGIKLLSDTLGLPVTDLLPPKGVGVDSRVSTPDGNAAKVADPLGEEEGPGTPSSSSWTEPKPEQAQAFLSACLRIVKSAIWKPKEKLQMLAAEAPIWIEILGPGYADMVRAVMKNLELALNGKAPLEDAIRYADTHVRYWNPNPRRSNQQ